MHVRSYVYDSSDAPEHVEEVLALLEARDEDPDLVDVAEGDPEDARREATLAVKNAVRIGTTPDDLFGEDGRPDFAPGALITEAETGRRSLHVGEDALEALSSADDTAD